MKEENIKPASGFYIDPMKRNAQNRFRVLPQEIGMVVVPFIGGIPRGIIVGVGD